MDAARVPIDSLVLDLIAHRMALLQANLTDNAQALVLVVHRLVEPIFGEHRYRVSSSLPMISTSLMPHTPLSSHNTGQVQLRAAKMLERAESASCDRLLGEGFLQ